MVSKRLPWVIDRPQLLIQLGERDAESLAANYRAAIGRKIRDGELTRDARWTESIAIGSEAFVARVAKNTHWRVELDVADDERGTWTVRETPTPQSCGCPVSRSVT